MRSIRNNGINSVVLGGIIGLRLNGNASLGESAEFHQRGEEDVPHIAEVLG